MKITARRALGALALTMLIASAGAQAATDTPPPPPAQAGHQDMPHGGPRPGMQGGPEGMGPHGPGPMGFAVMRHVEEIAELYHDGGHPEMVLPFYRDVLAQTKDPMVRARIRDAIVEEQLKPADTSAAILTLRDQLRDDLAALDAHRPKGEK